MTSSFLPISDCPEFRITSCSKSTYLTTRFVGYRENTIILRDIAVLVRVSTLKKEVGFVER